MILRGRKSGFTLVELLVVTAILAVLTALLFPVFRRVEDASRATVCASNFRQVSAATLMYMGDYDERFVPVNDQVGREAHSDTDHTWVQVVLPYTKNFSVFHCPANPTSGVDISTFDQDLVPGDTSSEFYSASLHVNTGYNYQYLAPILLQNGQWSSQPRSESEIRDSSRTLLFVDSKWSMKNSEDSGGGSWLVVPPCRYELAPDGSRLDTFLGGQQAQKAFVYDLKWSGNEEYGGAWPWHMGRMTISHVDGSISSMTTADLSADCDVKTQVLSGGSASGNGGGSISGPTHYPWTPF